MLAYYFRWRILRDAHGASLITEDADELVTDDGESLIT